MNTFRGTGSPGGGFYEKPPKHVLSLELLRCSLTTLSKPIGFGRLHYTILPFLPRKDYDPRRGVMLYRGFRFETVLLFLVFFVF